MIASDTETHHATALGKHENAVENSNLKIKGEIPMPYRINAKTVGQTAGST